MDAEISEESMSLADDDTVYVAVGKDVGESKSTLLWALQNFSIKKACLVHVHQPAKMIPLIGGNFPASRLEQHELRQFRELERKIMHKVLDDYLLLCRRAGVHAEKLYIEKDDIGKGIVELMYQHAIEKLVMGAAADRHYSEGMMDLQSRKAKYVQQCAPPSCQIWFICNWHLIHTGTSTDAFADLDPVTQHISGEITGLELELCEIPDMEEEGDLHAPDALEQNSVEQLYKQLDRAMEEAEKFKRQAFEESLIRGEAEKTSIKALRKAKVLGSLYAEELRHRKETEEALVKEKQEHEKTKDQRDETHLVAIDQRLLWETDRSKFDNKIKELGDEVLAYVEQCKEYEKERDELVKELSKERAEDASSMHIHQLLSVFSLSEIQEASRNFDPSVKIGEGGYGNIYKGFLRHTPVAIKMLNPESMQGHAEFKQEVDVLSKLRHPHLVTLIGACPEACALIYEYLPNGNLEDRLNCQGNTPPMSWQARIRIATELCSALIFLHYSTPTSIVHGDLKPGNVLLDANLSCKLSDFGICRALSLHHNTRNITQYHKTDPKGTFLYLDPYFLTTGELSPKSDTYAFGIILLQLLTGRPAFGLVKEIGDVIDEENLTSFIDPLAGDWPFVQAKQLARLALKCCQMERSSRPDLASEVWNVLEPMRDSCGPLSRFQFGSLQCQTPPPYFICPILQEVMQDPHIAADGFTYEAEALRGWLESGHDTSPMTNLELERFELIPNHALRSVIQEWLQQH
uniref:RING-type E3 ubiquitin transferase n=1 Tax=Populus davidiana TaxID=266767 RepID=A0A6M2EAZ4_9ROSI